MKQEGSDAAGLENIDFELEKANPAPIFNKGSVKHDPKTHVQVRLLCSQSLGVDLKTGVLKDKEAPKKLSFFKKCLPPKVTNPNNAVILHIHGGGFIAMSSASHQTYTRIWANELGGIPIFSVDYRLAPENKFPDAINDVWQVYYWICEHAETFLGIKVEKIIVVGDSAGGNLSAALTSMCVQRNCRKPDGVVLVYPALNMDMKAFVPSFLYSIDDPLLPYNFLKMCLTSYAGDYSDQPQCSPELQYLLSPGLSSDSVVQNFPTTRIMVAQNDPLRD